MRGRDRLAVGVMKAQEQRNEVREDTSDGNLQSTLEQHVLLLWRKKRKSKGVTVKKCAVCGWATVEMNPGGGVTRRHAVMGHSSVS